MNVNRKAILLAASLVVFCVGVSRILPSFTSPSSIRTVASSGTIVYHTYIVATLTELTNVVSKVVPGDIVLIRGGIYRPTSEIRLKISGTSGNPITYEAYPNEKVVVDGSSAELSSPWDPLVRIQADWNVFRNIEVTNSSGIGIRVSGDDVILDHIETHHNNGAGAGTVGGRTQFLYCVAHDNIDTDFNGQNADGLSASYSSESYFLGCLVYGNSDDGIDLWGSNNTIVERCVAYGNGILDGDGRGFKLGPGSNNRAVKCIAFNNRNTGFDTNGASNDVIDHCTAFKNGKYQFISYTYPNTLTNNIGKLSWSGVEPTQLNNSWNLGITDPGFISTDSASPDFLSLRANSPCLGKASDGSDLGALQYGETIVNLLKT